MPKKVTDFRLGEIETIIIQDFFNRCHLSSREAGWWHNPNTGEPLDGPYVIATKLILIISEVCEAMEGFRSDQKDDKLPHRDALEVELADAVIRIGDLAGRLNYDLVSAVVEKMEYNYKRADHKVSNRKKAGGKKF